MNKQEYIKLKWEESGMDFSMIQDNVNEDGWHVGDVDLIPESVYVKCTHYSKSLGKMAERPMSLDRVEHNNGWTKIESEKDLPVEDICLYKIMISSEIQDEGFYSDYHKCFINEDNKLIFNVTHWRPIVEIPNPLY